uniref:Cytochrome b5 heme-binding domain-containing protein n=1 Tax=Ditylenchus dipsaci TaxID=166011 RepID=A0A915EM52_9BILA
MDLDALPQYTREEVCQSNQSNWLIVNDLVYDLTDFLRIHPGGSEVLLEYMGLDATSVFEDVGHSSMARTIMLRYVIGRVVTASNLVNLSTSQFCRRDSSVTATEALLSFPHPFKEFEWSKLSSNVIIHPVNCARLHICVP